MSKLLYIPAFVAALLFVTPVAAQVTNGKVTTAAPTYVTNTISPLSLTTGGLLRVDASSGGSITIAQPVQVVGNVANAIPDSGDPIKIGGKAATSAPTGASVGDRVDAWYSPAGGAVVSGVSTGYSDSTSSVVFIPSTSTSSARPLWVVPSTSDGQVVIRNFTCPNSAVVNVTAGSTAQLVALASGQLVRVCGFSVAMSLAGTAKFIYGTGVNCATNANDITGAIPLAIGVPWSLSSSSNSLFTTTSGNALCLTAATGNVVGFINYVQF